MPDIKVIVFGRGNGESILVELENECWMVVDSFINPLTNKPTAISYLESIGLDPKRVLKFVILTHFHADHIRGMERVIQAAHPDAKICFPDALTRDEALTYFNTLDILSGYDDASKVREMVSILDHLSESKRTPVKLSQDKLIFENEYYTVTALSPSDFDSQQSLNAFVSEIASENFQSDIATHMTASNHTPNHFCVALSIQNKQNNRFVLLGGDLEICSDSRGGWDAALSTIKAPHKNSIDIFKVPHHGSETAYHEATWQEHVSADVIAVITTFGSCSLPREELVKIFKTYTPNVLCATKPRYRLKDVLSPKSQKILGKLSSSIEVNVVTPRTAFGYIEGTHGVDGSNYELFGDAVLL